MPPFALRRAAHSQQRLERLQRNQPDQSLLTRATKAGATFDPVMILIGERDLCTIRRVHKFCCGPARPRLAEWWRGRGRERPPPGAAPTETVERPDPRGTVDGAPKARPPPAEEMAVR